MRSSADSSSLEEIRSETREILRAAIGSVRHVAILDAPNQRNVGDTLIWLGEIAYLEQLGYEITHVSDLRGYDADTVRRELPTDGVILLHGGGNFGDLWVGHQRLRERIAVELRDYRIVQLPQSILFADSRRAAQANQLLGQHPDFLALIRDAESLDRASEQLPNVHAVFCPDMALGYEPSTAREDEKSPGKILVIARSDHESASDLLTQAAVALGHHDITVTDWWKATREPSRWRRARRVAYVTQILVRVRRKLRSIVGWKVPFPVMPKTMSRRSIYTVNEINIAYAIDLYASAQLLVVDRLHAHVLALLLGKRHIVLDNSYRKIGGVFDGYTGRFSTATYATDLTDVARILEDCELS